MSNDTPPRDPSAALSAVFTVAQAFAAIAALAGSVRLFGLDWTLLVGGIVVFVLLIIAETFATRPPGGGE